jgi:cell division septation protein DedD
VAQEPKDEGNLLIEAVSLLVQRQRETETWVAEQMYQADERAAENDRRYADLEARLSGIEEHLSRLVHDVGLPREPIVDERLQRLRAELAGLRATSADAAPVVHAPEPAPVPAPAPAPVAPQPPPAPADLPQATTTAAVATAPRSVGFWELLGATRQDRAGALMIAAGAVAVITVVLTQIRVG